MKNISTGLPGLQSLQGLQGPTGATGLSGDKFLTSSASATITPSSGTVNLTVAQGLAYIPGNSVVVVNSSNSGIRFEGRVQAYTSGTGQIVVDSIANIFGTFTLAVYNINLDGIDGPTGYTGNTGNTGSTGPTGFNGNIFNTSTVSSITPTPTVGGIQILNLSTLNEIWNNRLLVGILVKMNHFGRNSILVIGKYIC